MINAKENGFTLIELMITLVVVSILLGIAVPYLGNFTKNSRLTGQANDLVIAIQLARSEAVKRGINTIICPSSNQTSCSSNASDWQNGWLVFSDFNLNGNLEPGASAPLCEETEDCVMRTGSGLSHNNTLTTTATRLRFLPTGMSSASSALDFTIVSDDCRIDQARRVRVTNHGHTIVSTETCP
jgi:type IV fimbrial biogenesis protein FimT